MKVVIDTNSLLALVRYYLPFDKNGVLFQFIKTKIESGNIIIIDKVLEECKYISQSLILQKLPYLTENTFMKSAKAPFKTGDLIVPDTKQFFHLLDNVFVNSAIKRKLTDEEFQSLKSSYIESADIKMVILVLKLTGQGEQVVLVTEETETGNDNKLYKKIPAVCKELKIETMTLPELFLKYDDFDIDFKLID